MSRTTARRGLSALLVLACLAAALLVAAREQPAPARAPAFMLAADGALTLQNDRHGVAILQAAGMRPGDVAEGTATLSVSVPAALALRAEAGAERPGAGGGRLAERLVLAIDDVTSPGAPVSVYHGTVGGAVTLGTVPAGTDRRYRFRVTFPRGTGDNAFQDAALTARFVWTAVAAGAAATPTPTPAPKVKPTPAPGADTAPPAATPSPAPSPAAARITGLPAARGCLKRRRYTIAAKPAAGVRVTAVQVFVNNRKARAGRKPRKARLDVTQQKRTRVTVRVVVKTTAGTVTATRTYRLCYPRR